MRKVVYGINVSADGCCDHTKMAGGEDLHKFYADVMRDSDVLLYGRVTYELMVPFWPDVARKHTGDKTMDDFADAFDAVKKIVVVSNTLKNPDNKKVTVINSDLKNEVLKLKQEPGKDISVGGVDLPSQLMKLGLIDEYIIVVLPIVVGEGRRLWDGVNLPNMLELKLKESKVLPSGCVVMRYAKG